MQTILLVGADRMGGAMGEAAIAERDKLAA
jgi:hypothetical protein